MMGFFWLLLVISLVPPVMTSAPKIAKFAIPRDPIANYSLNGTAGGKPKQKQAREYYYIPWFVPRKAKRGYVNIISNDNQTTEEMERNVLEWSTEYNLTDTFEQYYENNTKYRQEEKANTTALLTNLLEKQKQLDAILDNRTITLAERQMKIDQFKNSSKLAFSTLKSISRQLKRIAKPKKRGGKGSPKGNGTSSTHEPKGNETCIPREPVGNGAASLGPKENSTCKPRGPMGISAAEFLGPKSNGTSEPHGAHNGADLMGSLINGTMTPREAFNETFVNGTIKPPPQQNGTIISHGSNMNVSVSPHVIKENGTVLPPKNSTTMLPKGMIMLNKTSNNINMTTGMPMVNLGNITKPNGNITSLPLVDTMANKTNANPAGTNTTGPAVNSTEVSIGTGMSNTSGVNISIEALNSNGTSMGSHGTNSTGLSNSTGASNSLLPALQNGTFLPALIPMNMSGQPTQLGSNTTLLPPIATNHTGPHMTENSMNKSLPTTPQSLMGFNITHS